MMHFLVRSDTKLTGLVWPMWLMAVASLPFVAMLMGGALLMLYAAPRKRLQAQLVVRNCGGWPGVPRALWFGAKQGLRRWPYLLAGVLVVGATIGTAIGFCAGSGPLPQVGMLAALAGAVLAPAFAEDVILGRTRAGSDRNRR